MASIRADMQLNAAPFLDGISRVQTQMRNLQASVAGITGVFFAARAALSGFTGVLNQMRGTLDLGGKLSDLAASTGVAAGEMLVLQRAFQDNGLGADEAGTMINRMQRAIIEAGQGSATYARAFESLGLSISSLRDLTPEQQLRAIGQAIASIKDPAESTAASMQIFGRAGGRLQTFFENFDGAVGQARTSVGSLADVMNGNADRFDFISDAIAGASQKISQFFAGFLSETIDTAPFEALNRLDLTGLGQTFGDITNQITGMVGALRTSLPVFAGLTAATIAFKTGMAGAVTSAATQIPALVTAAGAAATRSAASFAAMGASAKAAYISIQNDARIAAAQSAAMAPVVVNLRSAFVSIGASARAAFALVQQSATSAGASIQGAFVSSVASVRAAMVSIPQSAAAAFASLQATATTSAASVNTSFRAAFANMLVAAKTAALGSAAAIQSASASIAAAVANPRASLAATVSAAEVGMSRVATAARVAGAAIGASFTSGASIARAQIGVLAATSRAAFTSMVGAARSAGVAMKAALVSTGIGAVIVGIGLAIEKVMSKISAANEASRALRREGGDMSRSNNEIVAARRNIGSAEEQQAVLDDLDNRIAAVRERLGNISDEYDSGEAIAAATESLNLQLNLLQRHKEGVANTSAEYMAQVAAVRAQEQALIDAKRRAEELAKEVDRALASRDVQIEQKIIADLSPEAAEQRVLSQVSAADKTVELIVEVAGLPDVQAAKAALDAVNARSDAEIQLRAVGLPNAAEMIKMLDTASGKVVELALEATGAASIEELRARLDAAPDEKTVEMILRATGTENIDAAKAKLAELQGGTADISITAEGVTAEIERLRALGDDAASAERDRLMELIEAEKTLVAIKDRQIQQDKQRADQAARLADMQADMVLDSEKAVAEAMGDKAAVRAIEIEQKTRRLASQLESQGEDPTAAREIARQKAELMQLAGEINASPMAQIARGDAQRSIGLGGSAGLGPSVDVQKEIARKQEAANRLLADIKTALNNRTPVMLAEVFD
jgi:hypothetical protein